MIRHAIALSFVLLVFVACTADDTGPSPTAPLHRIDNLDGVLVSAPAAMGPRPAMPASILRFVLEYAAAGLLYLSESDYPFTYHFHKGPAPTPLTVSAFRSVLGIPADSTVEELSLDEFFARHIERVDPADSAAVALVPRYLNLRETIRNALHHPRVFRVGRIAVTCYIVGTDRKANIVGLTTVAIET
jgi:hypothetical protein